MTDTRKTSATLALLTLVAFAVVLTACAAGDPRFTVDTPAGFWLGLWHGAIAPATLVIGVFDDGVGMYELHNTGGWYDFGFLVGATSIWGAGSHRAGCSLSRRKQTC
jgi:hypothetical protein